MKKVLVILAILVSVIIANKEESIIIPESSIRFRVIANSNTLEDQVNKNKVSKSLSTYIYSLIKNATTKEEANNIINTNYKELDEYVKNYLDMNNINTQYNLSIGRNYFEEKSYKGIKYDAGYYDSIVLSLGNKQGINWWCVMYPPLCLIDEDKEELEYTTLIKEMLERYKF